MRRIRTFVFISVSFVISLILTSFLFDRAILFVAEDSVTFCYLDIFIGFLTYLPPLGSGFTLPHNCA